jgi:hypothetical protein
MRMILIVLLLVIYSSSIDNQELLTYQNILNNYCSPPFHFYKSWCYYIFPQLKLDWSSADRLCRSIDQHTYLVHTRHDDDMMDPLRDILVNRERSLSIQSVWTNTTWGQQRRTLFNRRESRSCRKLQLKSTKSSGRVDLLRMPFSNCREKHMVMCRKVLPSNVTCGRPWSLVYGICYYIDEQARMMSNEDEERTSLQCQAWHGELFYSSKEERTVLQPFLFYALHGIQFI